MIDDTRLIKLPSVGGADCWLIQLDGFDTSTATKILSPSELSRAARFKFEKDRHQFFASRIAMRLVLSTCLGGNNEEIAIHVGLEGKPFLPSYPLHFNLSHSEGWALIGIHPSHPVGVDIEIDSNLPDMEALMQNCFTEQEQLAIKQSPSIDKLPAFYRCWTRKEACLKALGSGLTIEPITFSAGILDQSATIEIPIETTQSAMVTVHSLALSALVKPATRQNRMVAALALLAPESHHLAI